MWPFNKELGEVINKTTSVRVHGVKFTIKKIDIENYLDGSKVMLKLYDIYKVGKPVHEEATANLSKIKDHFRDVFMSSVVEPKLSRSQGIKGHIFVDHLFTEWDLANTLYSHIIEYTYGKKKLVPSISQEVSS